MQRQSNYNTTIDICYLNTSYDTGWIKELQKFLKQNIYNVKQNNRNSIWIKIILVKIHIYIYIRA